MSTAAVAKKKKIVEKLKEKIEKANVLVISDFRSISVKEITELRKKLLPGKAEFKVVKNTLVARAMEAAGFSGLGEQLKGPTALLLGYEEPVFPLKTLVEFIAEIEKGELRAGIIEKALVEKKDLAAIAKLPPKEVLIAKVIGGLQSPIYGLVNVLQGTTRKLVYVLNAIKEKKGEVK
jgi:large subunit ribosomal protein L10